MKTLDRRTMLTALAVALGGLAAGAGRLIAWRTPPGAPEGGAARPRPATPPRTAPRNSVKRRG